jgi:hypothetical protein
MGQPSTTLFYWMGGMWGRGGGGMVGGSIGTTYLLMKVHDTLTNVYVNWRIIIRYKKIYN